MLPRTCWALLLLCATAGFFGWLSFCSPPEELGTPLELRTTPEEELWEQGPGWPWPRPETIHHPLDETLIVGRQRQVTPLMENITQQLENDLALLLAQQQQMKEVVEKLQQVNQSLGLMLVAMEGAWSQLENSLQDLHAVLNPAGHSPRTISTCVLHGLVLLVVLLVPTPPRAIFILLFLTSSVLSELLSIPTLFVLLVLTAAGHWLVMTTHRGAQGAQPVFPHHQFTSTPDREREMELLQEKLDRMEMSCLQEPSCLEQPLEMTGDLPGLAGKVSPLVPDGWRTKLSSCGLMPELTLGARKHWEPKPSNLIQSLASDVSSMSPRSPCQGLTKAGQQCRKKAIHGRNFCHVHATGQASCSGTTVDSSTHL